MQIESTHFISLNVRGLRNTEKRQIIYNWIKKQKLICFLQEIHVDKTIEKMIKFEWNGTFLIHVVPQMYKVS